MLISNRKSLFIALTFAAIGAQPSVAQQLEEVVVTADFRQSPEMRYAASLTVVGDQQIRERAAQHLDEILNVTPNVNFSSGASRGRYLQIRGIGERSQFVDPVNPSVGLMIDGVNLSGVGNASTLFDVEQVEVLRGPQGTRFGANALAGMVNIQSKAPTEAFEGQISGGVANYDSWQNSAMLSGPLTDSLLGRVAVQQYRSDGFIDNTFLNKDDTNDRDELTARAKFRWLASDSLTLDTTIFYIDVDNGYDAFSLDNNRTTLSDEPGTDAQETLAVAVAADWAFSSNFDVELMLSAEQTEIEYGYDEDWTNTQICEGLPCDSALFDFDWWYSSTDTYYRDRDSLQLDVRLVSSEEGKILGSVDWVAGIYAIDQDEDLVRKYFNWDAYTDDTFTSEYETRRIAAYGELSFPLSEKLTLSLGGRVEDFSADYEDSRNVVAEPNETLWGGEVSLEYAVDENTFVYGLLSRGFKAGGVNGEALGKASQNQFDSSVISFLSDRLEFETETANNLELGIKGSYWQDRWQLRLALFAIDRKDVQLKGWYNENQLFVGYIDNGAEGENRGVELETSLDISQSVRLFGSLGLLDTEIKDFYVLGDDGLVDKSGRDQAHAPGYQFNLGVNVVIFPGLSGRIEIDGKDEFYFSDSHDQKSDSYELIHVSLSYAAANYEIRLWGRNLADEDYAVRGFYFPNDPREFYGDDQAYIQLGDPRTYGITATYNF